MRLLFMVDCLLQVLGGNLPKETITTVYGPPACGKSTLCFEYCVSYLQQGKKVIYIDTEGGFSPERVMQLYPKVSLQDIIVLSPKSFEDQTKLIKSLNKHIKSANHIGLVIVDSLVMLYRLKLGGAPQKINSELGEQLRLLTEISRTFHIPVLVINQMYHNFETKEAKMVGGMVIEYWSKTIVEITPEGEFFKMLLKKHKFKPSGEECLFKIEGNGLKKWEQKGFSFFSRKH